MIFIGQMRFTIILCNVLKNAVSRGRILSHYVSDVKTRKSHALGRGARVTQTRAAAKETCLIKSLYTELPGHKS